MTMQLDLSPELASRLWREASRRGESADGLATRLLEENLPAANRARAATELLLLWAQEADSLTDEEAASNTDVLKAFDADRLSNRPLFSELPGLASGAGSRH